MPNDQLAQAFPRPDEAENRPPATGRLATILSSKEDAAPRLVEASQAVSTPSAASQKLLPIYEVGVSNETLSDVDPPSLTAGDKFAANIFAGAARRRSHCGA
jgi:hypothetical protein